MKTFRLTADHIKLLKRAYIDWNGDEYGAPTINPKRPYGNGDVEADICGILGWPRDFDDEEVGWSQNQLSAAEKIHVEMKTALQILLLHVGRSEAELIGEWGMMKDYDHQSWMPIGK